MGQAGLSKPVSTEIDASIPAMQGLGGQVEATFEKVLSELCQIIRGLELQALNRVLEVNHRPDRQQPDPAKTYRSTKDMYERFNVTVAEAGRSFFEGDGRRTPWSLWVSIYGMLQECTYDEEQHPDHRNAIEELKEMKLVRSRLELR